MKTKQLLRWLDKMARQYPYLPTDLTRPVSLVVNGTRYVGATGRSALTMVQSAATADALQKERVKIFRSLSNAKRTGVSFRRLRSWLSAKPMRRPALGSVLGASVDRRLVTRHLGKLTAKYVHVSRSKTERGPVRIGDAAGRWFILIMPHLDRGGPELVP